MDIDEITDRRVKYKTGVEDERGLTFEDKATIRLALYQQLEVKPPEWWGLPAVLRVLDKLEDQ